MPEREIVLLNFQVVWEPTYSNDKTPFFLAKVFALPHKRARGCREFEGVTFCRADERAIRVMIVDFGTEAQYVIGLNTNVIFLSSPVRYKCKRYPSTYPHKVPLPYLF